MTIHAEQNKSLALLLRTSSRSMQPIPPLREMHCDPTVEQAYAIQEINHLDDLLQGRAQVGSKIGLTSVAVQQQLGVNEPDFGRLYADMEFVNGSAVDLNNFIQPKVEAEIAFRLSRAIDKVISDPEELRDYIDFAFAALEVVDSRIEGWNIKIFDTVADNASSAAFVLSNTRKTLDQFDPVNCRMSLFVNGEVASQGSGAACLGHPLIAVKWLANKMLSLGQPLQAGEIILSGALGPMVTVTKSMSVEAQIEGLGTVFINFAGR